MRLDELIGDMKADIDDPMYRAGFNNARRRASEILEDHADVIEDMTRLLASLVEPADNWAEEFLGAEVTGEIRKAVAKARALR